MKRKPVITVAEEGGLYRPGRNPLAPIRIYADRWVEDDIFARFNGRVRRERLSRREFRDVRRAAAQNRKMGRV